MRDLLLLLLAFDRHGSRRVEALFSFCIGEACEQPVSDSARSDYVTRNSGSLRLPVQRDSSSPSTACLLAT